MELKDILADWQDYDVAAFQLGCFWASSRMAQAGVLLKDEDDDRYRWNPEPPDLS